MANRYTSIEHALLNEARAVDERGTPVGVALERCTLPAFIHDGERITHVNPVLLGWLGHSESELEGANVAVLAEERDRAGLLAAIGATSGEPPDEAHVQRFRAKEGE